MSERLNLLIPKNMCRLRVIICCILSDCQVNTLIVFIVQHRRRQVGVHLNTSVCLCKLAQTHKRFRCYSSVNLPYVQSVLTQSGGHIKGISVHHFSYGYSYRPVFFKKFFSSCFRLILIRSVIKRYPYNLRKNAVLLMYFLRIIHAGQFYTRYL